MVEDKNLTLAQSFRVAFFGIGFAFKHNRNLRIAFVAGIIVVLAGIMFGISLFEMSVIAVMIVLVICAEMINSAIEEMVDLITKEHHAEAKIAKDVSAGMALLALLSSIVVGLLVFVPHMITLIQSLFLTNH